MPEWPAEAVEPTVAELAMWARVWRLPQAIVWERNKMEDQVVVYVRTMIFAMGPYAKAPILTAARQMSEKLLLDTFALRAARIAIDTEEAEPEIDDTGNPVAPVVSIGSSARDRIRIAQPVGFDEDDDDEDEFEQSDDDGVEE